MKQLDKIARLVSRKRGATAMEIIGQVGTVCPHKRISELKENGWVITRKPVPGKNYGAYHGVKVA